MTACEPKDVAVMPKDKSQRLKQNAQNKKKTAGQKRIYFQNAAGALFMMDKQVEALEIITLALPKADDTKTQYRVGESKSSEGQRGLIHSLSISSDKTPLRYVVGTKEYSSKLIKNWDVKTVVSEDRIVEITATAKGGRMSADLASGGTYININEDLMSITVKPSNKDVNLLDVAVTSKGSMSGKTAGKNITRDKFDMTMNFRINSASLGTSNIMIREMTGFFKKSDKLAHLNTKIAGTTMALELSGLCNSLSGQAVYNDKFTVVYDKDRVISGRTTFKLPDCGKRSSIELSRFLP